MKKYLAAVAVALLALASPCRGAPERVTPIMVEPTGEAWNDSYAHAEGGTTVETTDGRSLPLVSRNGKRALQVRIQHTAGGSWHVGVARSGWTRFHLDDYGPDGTLQFDLLGEPPPGTLVAIVDTDGDGDGPDQAVSAEVALRTPESAAQWRRVALRLAEFAAAAPALDLGSMDKVVFKGESRRAGQAQFFLSNIAFHTTAPERAYAPVKVDQVGYPPDWHKVAKVTPPELLDAPKEFIVQRVSTGEEVHRGELELVSQHDANSGDHVYNADFTAVRAPGWYSVQVPDIGRSAPFRIGPDVYDLLLHDVCRFWFYQRCGTELEAEHAGASAHPVCHVYDETVPDPRGGTRDCRGGWHDAGDMNRYAAWTIPSVSMLLTLYRHHPDAFSGDQLGIPESGNGLPDLLDEVKHELLWLRRMIIREGPDAGRVYDRIHHTLTEQPAGVDVFTERHGLSGTTPEACCAVVANMAHAHMVYRRFPSQAGFAGQCLDDALLCWERLRNLEEPPVRPAFTAAALMFEATGREDTHAMVRELAPEILSTWHGHINYGNYDAGLATYALSERDEVDPDLQAELRGYYRDYADAVVKASQANGYREPMIEGVVFTWGSNGSCIAKSGAHLLMVNRFAPDPRYVETARESLHWLLGRNPVDTCMVTGHGRPPLGPIFHAMYGPSGPGLAMPPGYLAGGPTNLECPGISRHPAKCWRPDHACWELTEPSLGYQGNLNYLLGALTASPQ